MSYAIRPLGFGEILNQGINVFREHFVLIAGSFAAVYLPVQLAFQIIMYFLVTSRIPDDGANMTPEQLMAATSSVAVAAAIAGIVGGIVSFIAYTVAEGALIHSAAKSYLGEQETVGTSVSFGLSRVVPRLLTGLLKGVIIVIGLILFIVPGVYFLFRYALTSSVVVIEGRSGMAALGRSKELMSYSGHIYQLIGLGLICALIGFAIGMPVGLLGDGIIAAIVTSVLQTLVSAFTATVFVVFYFSARCRIDGFDLDRLAESLAAQNATN